jgi:hypothetical protein
MTNILEQLPEDAPTTTRHTKYYILTMLADATAYIHSFKWNPKDPEYGDSDIHIFFRSKKAAENHAKWLLIYNWSARPDMLGHFVVTDEDLKTADTHIRNSRPSKEMTLPELVKSYPRQFKDYYDRVKGIAASPQENAHP